MSNFTLFILGVGVTIPAGIAIGGLVLAAIADGRDNDRMQATDASDSDPA